MLEKIRSLYKRNHSNLKTNELKMDNQIKKVFNAPVDAELMDYIYKILPENQKFDNIRFYKSLIAIKTILNDFETTDKLTILELGASGVFTELLYKYIPNIEVTHVLGTDYRKAINNDTKFDLIIAMEIIEHLGDLDSDNVYVFSTFLHTGLDNFLNNLKKNFHKNTRLLITTPNVNSYFQFFNLINCKNPYMYDLHIHEYGVYELKSILEKHFSLEYYDCIDLLNVNHWGFNRNFIDDMNALFDKYYKTDGRKFELNERGTNIFTVLKLN